MNLLFLAPLVLVLLLTFGSIANRQIAQLNNTNMTTTEPDLGNSTLASTRSQAQESSEEYRPFDPRCTEEEIKPIGQKKIKKINKYRPDIENALLENQK